MKRRLICFPPDFGGSAPLEFLFSETIYIKRGENFELLPTDVVLFEGGTDIGSNIYGEPQGRYNQRPDNARDEWEVDLFIKAEKAGAGMFGICRGAQLFCAMNDGTLIQHVNNHGSDHSITTNKGLRYRVPSVHHQMMAPVGNFELLAWSEPRATVFLDGNNKDCKEKLKIIDYKEPEVIFWPETKCLGVQSHPEYLRIDHPFVQYCRNLIKEYLFK